MSLFKKPKRKFRQRVTHSDSEDDDSTKDKSDATDQQKCKPKTSVSTTAIVKEEEKIDASDKNKISVGAKLLSFHDEEDDGEVFKVKKSNYSRRLARRLEKERKKKQEEAKQKAEESENSAPQPQEEELAPPDPSDKEDSPSILNGDDAEDMEIDSENEEEKKAAHPFKNVLKSGVIPDAATIYAMKKHRQMAREMGDFVALDERVQESKSRLIRDDENDRSDDDDGEEGRLSFAVNIDALDRQKAREAFLSVQEREARDLENEEEADEVERWEREQIRKGVGITQLQVSQQQQEQGEQQTGSSQQGNLHKTSKLENKPVKLLIPPITRERKDLTIEAIRARLTERLSSLQEMYAKHQRDEDECHNGLINSYDLINQLEKEGPLLENRFSLYQQMCGYVTDLVECLDIKVAKLEVLERQLHDILKLSAEKLIHRRQQDVRDQADDYSIVSSKVLRGSSLDMMDMKTASQDEAKLRRAAEREGRRMRRRKAREAKSLIVKHHEGMSSDDEETDIDIVKRNNQIDSILEQADTIFEDVKDEFGTIRGIRISFEAWRREQSTSYKEAYVSLCLPKLLSPFVRAELLKWNPLQKSLELEQMVWFETLVFYGWRDEAEDIDLDDPDLNLLPGIIEKIILPKLTKIARDVWDPLSTYQTLQLVNLTKRLIEEYPTINGKSKNTQEYLGALVRRLYRSLDEDVFIPLYPKELLENRLIGAVSFFQRQFWCAVKLIRNILSWQGILSDEALQDLALNCLLNRYLLLALQNSQSQKDTIEKCKTIVSTFPRAWFSQLKGAKTLPQLQMFARILKQFGQSQDETHLKEVIKEYAQMLMTIGAVEEATDLAKQFSLGSLKNQSHGKVS